MPDEDKGFKIGKPTQKTPEPGEKDFRGHPVATTLPADFKAPDTIKLNPDEKSEPSDSGTLVAPGAHAPNKETLLNPDKEVKPDDPSRADDNTKQPLGNEPTPAEDLNPKPAVELVEYTSHPIAHLILGRFEFVNGLLRLSPEDAEEFDKLWEQQPSPTKNYIHKLEDEKAKADAAGRSYLQSRRTRGVDTSTSGNTA